MLNAEFHEDEPLLGHPNGSATSPFCGGIFGIQGIAGADSHDEEHKGVCLVMSFRLMLIAPVRVRRSHGAPGHPHH
jgi:hypothetical protein